MLAILKLTFLVQAGLNGKPQTHLFAKGAAAVQHEKFELVVYHRKLRCGFFNHGIPLSPETADGYNSEAIRELFAFCMLRTFLAWSGRRDDDSN